MSHDPDGEYSCPKCGAQAALRLPDRITPLTHIALKCLECAHIAHVPRALLQTAVGPLDSNRSLD